MRFIPEADDQRWLLERLGELLKERGSTRFLQSPIVLPTAEFFPDVWRGDAPSVRRMLRRIMSYGGLGELGFEVELYDQGAEALHLHTEGVHHVDDAAAWFAGLDDDGTAHFGVASYHLDDPEALPGTLCHEVAHAYRARHQLTYFDDVEDELLTDLTTVFLGFGLLTTNLTHRYRRRHESPTHDSIEREMGGYLSPVAMSFALAAQMVCRDVPLDMAKKLARHLEPAQEGCFLESFKELRRSREKLLTDLGIASKPALFSTAAPAGASGAPAMSSETVFRIKPGWLRSPYCSGCAARLSVGDARCAKCGGRVAGDVRTPAEAKAAEAALAAEAGSALLAKLGMRR
jgi:hypothetical protein